MITGLNHITLAVADLDRSVAFYKAALDCRVAAKWNDGAYLAVGDSWLALLVDPTPALAPCRDTPMLPSMLIRMTLRGGGADQAIRRPNLQTEPVRGATRSISSTRDGHKLELHVGHLASRLAAMKARPKPGQQVCCV